MKHAREDYNRRIQDNEEIIPEDEPVFLLRAQDKHAPVILRFYASLVNGVGGNPDIIRNTMCHARNMEMWQEDYGCKSPDMKATDSVY